MRLDCFTPLTEAAVREVLATNFLDYILGPFVLMKSRSTRGSEDSLEQGVVVSEEENNSKVLVTSDDLKKLISILHVVNLDLPSPSASIDPKVSFVGEGYLRYKGKEIARMAAFSSQRTESIETHCSEIVEGRVGQSLSKVEGLTRTADNIYSYDPTRLPDVLQRLS